MNDSKQLLSEKKTTQETLKDSVNSFTLAEDSNDISMIGGGRVFSWIKDDPYELVFNETLILLDKNSSVRIRFPKEINHWSIAFVFKDDLTKGKVSYTTILKDKELLFTLNRWYSDKWVENSIPDLMKNEEAKIHLFIKFRSEANEQQNFRSLTVTVWKKEIK
jgi:hypothetical protein